MKVNLNTFIAHRYGEEALELVRQIINDRDNPFISDGYGREYCFFCVEERKHSESCIWLRSKSLINRVARKIHAIESRNNK